MNEKRSGLFSVVTSFKGAFFYLCLGSHNILFYMDDVVERVVQRLAIEKSCILHFDFKVLYI